MECCHSRGQHQRKVMGTKESRIGLEHQHGRRFIVLEHQGVLASTTEGAAKMSLLK